MSLFQQVLAYIGLNVFFTLLFYGISMFFGVIWNVSPFHSDMWCFLHVIVSICLLFVCGAIIDDIT